MFTKRDFLLLATIYSALAGGIFFPEIGGYFSKTPVPCLMLLLFLAFLPIRLKEMVTLFVESPVLVMALFVLKSLVFPVCVYGLFVWILPQYALGALVLTGVSTAVAAPFFATMLQANISLVIVLVVLTSLATPVTLPLLLELMEGSAISMDILPMIKMLGLVVLVPVLVAETLNAVRPRLSAAIFARQFPVSLVTIFIANMGIFSEYAPFFRGQPAFVFSAMGVAFLLAVIYALSALALFWRSTTTNQVSAVIILAFVNSFLALVFSARFFGPTETTLCAMFSVPIFCMILPLRFWQSFRAKNHDV